MNGHRSKSFPAHLLNGDQPPTTMSDLLCHGQLKSSPRSFARSGAGTHKMALRFVRAGKSPGGGFREIFSGPLRAQCLHLIWRETPDQVKATGQFLPREDDKRANLDAQLQGSLATQRPNLEPPQRNGYARLHPGPAAENPGAWPQTRLFGEALQSIASMFPINGSAVGR
jgi:hypothetical protein